MQIITEKTETKVVWKDRIINVDIGDVVFELDALQQELLNRYLRSDKNFLRAYYTNYTGLFMQFIKDKVRLNEPISLSMVLTIRQKVFDVRRSARIIL